jgi:vancomycin permeability regulator SanA
MVEEMRREESPGAPPPGWTAVAWGLALFLGGFTLLNLAGDLVARGFDANLWWVDLRGLPSWVAAGLLWAAGILLAAFGLRPRMGRARAIITVAAVLPLLAFAVENVIVFYRLASSGAVKFGVPVPLSLLVALALAAILAGAWRCSRAGAPPTRRQALAAAATVAAALVGFPLLQMALFGTTDYRRPADAVVVLGARVYADGTPSLALADRVRTACDLHAAGLVPRIVLSGGPGDGPIHETEAMAVLAANLGVPAEAMVLDPQGLSTGATVWNTTAIFEREGWKRVIAVSHFYHLPRVKMAYGRAGWDVFTVPARETRVLRKLPYLIAREVVALWAYYAAGALGEPRPAEE